jgi:uncharacterized protein YuzB (UPF0349 family)
VTSIDAGGDVSVTVAGDSQALSVTDITATGQAVTLEVSGAIDGGADATNVTAATLTISDSASVGTNTVLQTSVDSMNVDSRGAVVVDELNGVTVTSLTADSAVTLSTGGDTTVTLLDAGGTVDLSTSGDAVVTSLTATGQVDLSSAGDLSVTNITASGQVVNLDAMGDVDGDTGTNVSALTLNISDAANVGATTTLHTAVTNLSVNSDGVVLVDEHDGVNVADITAGGAVTLDTAGTTSVTSIDAGGDVSVTVAGDNRALSVTDITATGQAVTLDVSGAIDGGADATNVTAATLSINDSASVGTNTVLQTSVDSMNVDSRGAVVVDELNGLTVTSLTADSAVTLSTGGYTTATHITAGGDVVLTVTGEDSDLSMGSITANDQAITLTVGGVITDGDEASDLNASSLNITAAGVGSSSDALDSTVGSVTVSSTGGVYLNETDDLSVVAITAEDQAVVLSVGGALGSGQDATNVTASSLDISASSSVGAAAALQTAVDSLDIVSSGVVNVAEVDGLTINSISSDAEVTLITAGDTTATSLTAGGDVALTVTGTDSDLNVGSITATDQAIILTVGGVITDGDATSDLNASSLNITAAGVGSSTDALDTTVGSVTVSSTGGVYLNETDALTVSIDADGVVSVNTGGDTTVSGITAGGDVDVTTTGDLTVTDITAQGQAVSLDVGGDIVRGQDATNVTASSLDISASSSVGAAAALQTAVDSLDIVSSGVVNVAEVDGVSINSLSSDAAVTVSTAGDTTVTHITAGGDVALTVTGADSDLSVGSITAADQAITLTVGGVITDGDAAADLSASSLNITAAGVGSSTDALDTTVGSVTVSSTGGVYLNETDGVTASIDADGVVSVNTGGDTTVSSITAGDDVDVTTTGDLTVMDITASNQVVSLDVGGDIVRGQDATNVTATSLDITASSSVGAAAALQTAVDSLDIVSSGVVNVAEVDGVSINSLSSDAAVTVSTAGDTTATRITAGGDVDLTVTGADSDLSVGSIVADEQAVVLSASGLINDQASLPSVSAQSLSVEARGVGSATQVFNVDVDTVSGQVGTAGMYLESINGLAVDRAGLAAAGDTQLAAADGDVSLLGDLSLSGDAALTLLAPQGAIHQAADSTISTSAGDVAISAYGSANVSQVLTTSGQVQMRSATGGFSVAATSPGLDYGDQPAVIQGSSVEIAAPLSGTGALEFVSPNQGESRLADLTPANAQVVWTPETLASTPVPLPVVLGDVAAQQVGAPAESESAGIYLSLSELSLLQDGFERIVLGSQDPRQSIWLNGANGSAVVFKDPLVLVSAGVGTDAQGNKLAGEVNISGALSGQGLTVLGSGSTTHLFDAEVVQDGDITIVDSLVIESDTLLQTLGDGDTISIQGSVLIKSGATLTLDAANIHLGSFGGRGDSVVLQAGATLVLGTQHLTVDSDVTLNGGETGQLVLRGDTQAGVVSDFALSTLDLETLSGQMVDATWQSLQVGVADTVTTVLSPSLWSEQIGDIQLWGDLVRLGAPDTEAAWRIGSHSSFDAVAGDLELHADMVSDTGAYISLNALAGQVRMAPTSTIVNPGGLVALNAADGITVGEIDTTFGNAVLSGAVSLDSAGGTVTLAADHDGVMGVRAQVVSMYGYGQATGERASGDRALRVEAETVQVSAPEGLVSRGLTLDGVVYRVMSEGQGYVQLQLQGELPDRVLLPNAEVAQQPVQSLAYMALRSTPSEGWTNAVQTAALNLDGLSAFAQSNDGMVGQATRSYLSAVIRPVISGLEMARSHQSVWVNLVSQVSSDDDVLLSDLSYGFSDEAQPSFVMGLPGVQPLSSGTPSTADVWFDYLILG